jgi:anti-sigma factor RsiW
MTPHESRATLALAASGGLSPEEARKVEQHLRECPECRRELETWGAYTRGLAELPQPTLPLGLVARTQARVLREREGAVARRRQALLLGSLAVFSWLVHAALWSAARVVTGGVLEVFGVNLVSAFSWFVVYSMLAVITATVSAVMLGRDRVRRFHEPLQ